MVCHIHLFGLEETRRRVFLVPDLQKKIHCGSEPAARKPFLRAPAALAFLEGRWGRMGLFEVTKQVSGSTRECLVFDFLRCAVNLFLLAQVWALRS